MSYQNPLIDLAALLPDAQIDLKYASDDNITGRPIYQNPSCLIHADAAERLQRCAGVARLAGFRLRIYDAYRPQQAQHHLWQACPDPQFVIPMAIGSNHSRGTAIDLTLVDEQGEVLDMGAGFDDMREISHVYHPDVPAPAQRNRLLLNAVMFAGGFVGIQSEWWHFELPDAQQYPLLDDQFDCYPLPAG